MSKIPAKSKITEPTKKQKPMIIKDGKCLMIRNKTHDVFTDEKNQKLLIEYCRVYEAEMHIVEVDEAELITNMHDLAKHLCDATYKPSKKEVKIKILESKPKEKTKPTAKVSKEILTIEQEIENNLKENKKLSISSLYRKLSNDENDYKKIYNTFIKVRNKMEKEGWLVEKLDRGVYGAKKI